METMLKNMLLSALPPEVMAVMTKDNMDAVVMRAKAFVEQQNVILTTVCGNTALLEEILAHVSSGSKPRRGTRTIAASDGSGNTD